MSRQEGKRGPQVLTGAPGALYNEVYGLNQATLSILKEFREATTWEKGGEVVLRSGEQTGRVFFSGGRIAWVVASSIKQTFFGHITDKTKLSRDDLREVFESCKQSGDNFADTIVEWGLLDEPTLSIHLLEYVASCLVEVLSWPDLHAMGMPEARPFKGNLTFDLETVLAKALQQDKEKKLPFAGASVVELLDALDDEEEPADEEPADEEPADEEPADEEPSEAPAAITGSAAVTEAREYDNGADRDAASVMAEPPIAPARTAELRLPSQRRSNTGLIAAVVLLVAGVGGAAWYFTRGGGEHAGGAPDAAPAARVDASPPDAPRPDAPLPDKGVDARDGSSDTHRAPDAPAGPEGIVVGAASEGLGKMSITSYPSRSLVFFDGLYLGRRTPTKLDKVTAGIEHVIVVERPGFRQAVKRFKLAPGMQAQMNLPLRRTRRRLTKKLLPVRLVTEPPGALVYVNRKRHEQLTPATVELDRRRISKVQVLMKGFRPWRRRIKPPPEIPLTYQIKLRPRRARRRRHRRRRPRGRPGR